MRWEGEEENRNGEKNGQGKGRGERFIVCGCLGLTALVREG
jgi:hypothetical protein